MMDTNAKELNLTGTLQKVLYQNEENKYSPAISIDTELICTIEQTDGSTRTFDWNLLKM